MALSQKIPLKRLLMMIGLHVAAIYFSILIGLICTSKMIYHRRAVFDLHSNLNKIQKIKRTAWHFFEGTHIACFSFQIFTLIDQTFKDVSFILFLFFLFFIITVRDQDLFNLQLCAQMSFGSHCWWSKMCCHGCRLGKKPWWAFLCLDEMRPRFSDLLVSCE